MEIADKTVVSFDYKLTDPQGEVIDQSDPQNPLSYLHGVGQIVPGLERHLNGKSAGDEFTVTLQPEEAYGVRLEELVRTIPREMFDEPGSLEPGLQFDMPLDYDENDETDDGEVPFDADDCLQFTIIEVNEDEVVADANHDLAGLKVTFDVKIREVREASADELDNGQAQGTDSEAS